jgi:Protein of unknown function (DUF1475)
MIIFLRCFFIVVLASMLWVTSWASMECMVWKIPAAVVQHRWFIATLFDTYWAFFTFYCWLAYKETSWNLRIGWLIGIILLGNIAMSVYLLIQLFRVPITAKLEDILLRKV